MKRPVHNSQYAGTHNMQEHKSKYNDLEFDLLENGLDFIDNSLESILNSQEHQKLKYAVLHVSAGIELILKEILRQEHWSLLFENINNADYKDLKSGDFISVSFFSIFKRLKGVIDAKITDNQRKHFESLRAKRNKIEHFAFKESSNALKSTISKALTDILDILNANIDTQNISSDAQTLYKSIRKKSAKFIEFVEIVRAKLKEKLLQLNRENVKIINCPECLQDLFPLDGNNTCLFCDYTDTPERIAELYADNILNYNSYYAFKYGEDYPIQSCPSCGNETLIIENDSAFCITCDLNWDLDELSYCSDCGELYIINESDMNGFCDDCWEYKINRND